jgi:hypothetical protein
LAKRYGRTELLGGKGSDYSQPVNRCVVCALEDELVDDAIDPYGSADKFHLHVIGVLEDEMIAIECCEVLAADTAG